MAKKGKIKISKIKRNNHTTNKMKKAGTLRLQRHRQKVQKQKQPVKPEIEYSSESEASGDEWGDMLDEEEQQYIMKRLAKQPSLLSNVPEQEVQQTKSRKRKRNTDKPKKPKSSDSGAEVNSEMSDDADSDGSDMEEKYEKEMADRPVKKLKPLLPIKTKEGIIEQNEEVEDTESEHETNTETPPSKKSKTKPEDNQASDASEDSDSADSGMETSEGASEDTISSVQLLAARRDKLAHDKLRIGALCSSLLESPEKKIKNLFPILYLMEERLKDNTLNLMSVRKLATLSVFEVFKDILPEYTIRHQDYANVKLKKDTLALYKYEKELLEFYKRYLQRLEKATSVLRKKKGDTRKVEESTIKLGLVSLQCMCGMLQSRPNFNYATNIAQSVVPFLDSRRAEPRDVVTRACVDILQQDNRGEITLAIVRLINQLVKRRGENLHPSALECLLALRIRHVDMDADTELRHKKKQDEKHKKRIVNLSKREKKRAKKLKEVEKELLETEAQEDEASRRKLLTEVTKTVFHVYFRLLKQAPGSKLLAAALKGIAKFTHVINMEYYSDLVAILSRLITSSVVGPRERLLCAGAVLTLLVGAGDALNVDPATFHQHLYANMLTAHAGKSDEDAKIVLDASWQISCRARRVAGDVLQAVAKRLATLALQLQHGGALAGLVALHALIQQSKPVSSLLELENEVGSGRFDPLLPSPSHCRAHAARLTELAALARHYHPAVREAARGIVVGNIPQELHKLTPLQTLKLYDSSQMSFKPAIPAPKREPIKAKGKAAHTWIQSDFKEFCEKIDSNVQLILNDER